MLFFFFFKQKTAYEMRISDWSSDVCSSDLRLPVLDVQRAADDVPVAAQHVVAAAGQPLVEGRPQPVHGLELEALAQLARRPRRDVERHHAQVAEARLDVAALLVEEIGRAHV